MCHLNEKVITNSVATSFNLFDHPVYELKFIFEWRSALVISENVDFKYNDGLLQQRKNVER